MNDMKQSSVSVQIRPHSDDEKAWAARRRKEIEDDLISSRRVIDHIMGRVNTTIDDINASEGDPLSHKFIDVTGLSPIDACERVLRFSREHPRTEIQPVDWSTAVTSTTELVEATIDQIAPIITVKKRSDLNKIPLQIKFCISSAEPKENLIRFVNVTAMPKELSDLIAAYLELCGMSSSSDGHPPSALFTKDRFVKAVNDLHEAVATLFDEANHKHGSDLP